MIDQPPFPANGVRAVSAAGAEDRLGVIVPTRDRPERLERCLHALAAARGGREPVVYVCDSSRYELAAEVESICARHPFVELVRHRRRGASAARNVGTRACRAELVLAIDDDVYVEPDALDAIVDAYEAAPSPSFVAGCVRWGHWSSRPLVMRRIGAGREARADEEAEFVVSAMILYPRDLALVLPWNERLWPYDDRWVSLVWRMAGAEIRFAPDARAHHDAADTVYPIAHEADRIYANLFDGVFASRSVPRLLGFDLLGLAACAKHRVRGVRDARELAVAWARGHRAFVRDLPELRRIAEAALTVRRVGHP